MLKAKANLDDAKANLDLDDEYRLQNCAFNIQQCVEKILKQVYLEYGYSFSKPHDIEQLLVKLPAEQQLISDNTVEKLLSAADTLLRWETFTRYDSDYMVSRSRIKEMCSLASILYDEVSLGFGESSSQKHDITTLQDLHLFDK